MSLVVLSYPVISQDDFDWIQSVRATHDPLYYNVVDPHFTLVFPVVDVGRTDLVQHVRQQAGGHGNIPFVLRCATVATDAFGDYTHVFLVPDEGHSRIVKLHDRLYTGLLAPHLRLDIPFIPHIGIGNSLDPQACKELADHLNRRDFAVEGTLTTLDVALYENDRVETIEKIDLE